MNEALKNRWLDYAVDVVMADEHPKEVQCGGFPERPDGEYGHLRWPGYLGENYETGRVLLIGNVHTKFASHGAPTSLTDDLIGATEALRNDPADYRDDYLKAMQDAYLIGFDHWNVAIDFDTLLNHLHLDWTQVAYTNAAKSQCLPGDAAQGDIVSACLDRFKISDLAKDLQPRCIISRSAPARDRLTRAGLEPEYFHQTRNYNLPAWNDLEERCRDTPEQVLNRFIWED